MCAFKSAECVFPIAPRLCCLYALLDFKARYSQSSSSWSSPRLESLMWSLDPLVLVENLCSYDCTPTYGSPFLEVWLLTILYLCTATQLIVPPLISVGVGNVFCEFFILFTLMVVL